MIKDETFSLNMRIYRNDLVTECAGEFVVNKEQRNISLGKDHLSVKQCA